MIVVEHPNATIPDSVEVPRVGALRYELGFPTAETSRKLFDEMDFQRAVQAYLWGYPAVSFESIRLTAKQDLGMDYNDFGIADNFVDPKSGWLTANDTTIYAFVNIDLTRRAGRDRDPARSHRRPAGRLLAALGDRCRLARARRGEGREVPPRAARLRRRGSGVRLLRPSRRRCTTTIFWSAGSSSNNDDARRRGARPEDKGLPVERARRPHAEQVRLDLGAS